MCPNVHYFSAINFRMAPFIHCSTVVFPSQALTVMGINHRRLFHKFGKSILYIYNTVVAHWFLTNATWVQSPWSAVVVCERVWLVAHLDTWVFSGCSGFLPQLKHPCIIQDPIENKLSSFHGLSWVNMYVFTEYTFVFVFILLPNLWNKRLWHQWIHFY